MVAMLVGLWKLNGGDVVAILVGLWKRGGGGCIGEFVQSN